MGLSAGEWKAKVIGYFRHKNTVIMHKLKRRNHFLPECYQEGFAGETGRVWVRFAGALEAEPRNPRSVGRQRSFYIGTRDGREDDEIERFFGSEVESSFAALSQRIKTEKNEFSQISGGELGTLSRFIASQVVRTPDHKRTIDVQAGAPVDKNTFLHVMLRKMHALISAWSAKMPPYEFYTCLPYVGKQFITGDNPVMVFLVNEMKVWMPNDNPQLGITDLAQILNHPNYQFWVALTPHVCVALIGDGVPGLVVPPRTLDPSRVRLFNSYVRGQCGLFTLARDKESLCAGHEAA
jgi:Protein of unknown function (DUF4238)